MSAPEGVPDGVLETAREAFERLPMGAEIKQRLAEHAPKKKH